MLNKKKAVLGLIATMGIAPVLDTDVLASEVNVNGDVPVKGIEETQSVEYAIVTENLNLRVGMGKDKHIIATMPKNSKIEVLHKEDGWAKVKYNNAEGFASLKYLTIDNQLSPKTDSQKQMEVTSSTLNVRSGAGSKYSIVATVTKNTKLDVIEQMSNGWSKILYKGKVAYTSSKYLKNVATTQVPQTPVIQTPQTPVIPQTPVTPQTPTQKVELRGKKGFDYLLSTGNWIVPYKDLPHILTTPSGNYGYYNGYNLDNKYTGLDVSASLNFSNEIIALDMCKAMLGDESEAKRLLNDMGKWEDRYDRENFTKKYAGRTVEVVYESDAIVFQSYVN